MTSPEVEVALAVIPFPVASLAESRCGGEETFAGRSLLKSRRQEATSLDACAVGELTAPASADDRL